jgi:hypothetical protein
MLAQFIPFIQRLVTWFLTIVRLRASGVESVGMLVNTTTADAMYWHLVAESGFHVAIVTMRHTIPTKRCATPRPTLCFRHAFICNTHIHTEIRTRESLWTFQDISIYAKMSADVLPRLPANHTPHMVTTSCR